ncbi:MAG: RNA polymerase sigma factor [Phycisphaerales bacterium]|nr:MAG: RNA polymerase sigma factor [Phycisphaerales bacterium]
MEDRLLVWEFKQGSAEALQRIYEKYVTHLVTVAATLLNDVNSAEDIVHDFFVSFGQSADKLKVQGRLKAYLTTCVVNLVRDNIRRRRREGATLDEAESVRSTVDAPDQSAVSSEEQQQLSTAMGRLPYEQREVLILHLHGGLMFKQIARLQQVSTNTAWSRYRYALKKLRSQLNSEMAE